MIMTFAVVVLIVSLVVFAVLGIPLVWCLALSSVCSLVVAGTLNTLPILVQRIYGGGMQYALLAIFFFVLSGSIMQYGGLSKRLIKFANSVVGHISGSTSLVCMLACTFFAAVSGSSVGTTAAVGGTLYPELKRLGYPESYAAALPAAGGVLGVIIPPSINFILYGSITNVSPGKLLMAGLIPGLIGSFVLCIICFIIAKTKKYPRSGKSSFAEVLNSFKEAILALVMPFIIMGGIYSGIFTSTEAAAVSCAYGLLVVIVFYRELTFMDFLKILKETCRISANVMILLMSAGTFSYLLTIYQVPASLSRFLIANVSSPVVYIAGVMLLLIFLGMFMDVGAIILILGPMLAPLAAEFGIDPILFGLIFIFTLAIGLATPPFGACLFVMCSISGRNVMEIGIQAIPFCIALFLVVVLCAVFPPLATFLPSIMK
jgi:C4-dicarboxylate transporter DctM subunit